MICEAIPRQVNYLIDEAASVGEGANLKISYIHYYFTNHGLEEIHAHFHADNCSGQNKNNYFSWYFAWKIITELHQDITYSFLIVRHTKFVPNHCNRMVKKINFISSIYELPGMVEACSSIGVNKAH